LNPVIAKSVNFTSGCNQSPSPAVLDNVAVIDPDDGTTGRGLHAIGAVICDQRVTDGRDTHPANAFRKHTVAGVAGEVATIRSDARVAQGMKTVGIAGE
jgi:hypothetical protein